MPRRKRISIWGVSQPTTETDPLPEVKPRPKPIKRPIERPRFENRRSTEPQIHTSIAQDIPKKQIIPDPEPLPPPDKYPKEIQAITPRKGNRTAYQDQNKVRRVSLSLSVSEEEARLLRQAAADKGMFFSVWAREVLFRSMKRKAPKRPKR